MFDTVSILKRAAEKGGFVRSRYQERNTPTSFSDVSIMSFFGDIRSTFVASSLLLKRYREEVKGSKYFILLSWPGYECMFPYVDEYWTLRDDEAVRNLRSNACGFSNTSGIDVINKKHLNHFFDDRIDPEVLLNYYNQGIVQEFFDRFKNIRCFLPGVASSVAAGPEFSRTLAQRPGAKVLIYPDKKIRHWGGGKERESPILKEFWIELCKSLVARGYCPVVYRDLYNYDLSADLTNECIHYFEQDMYKVLAAMRAIGCVLDVFSGFSKLAISARCPFVCVDERARFNGLKEYELDDLCAWNLPKEYIYAFVNVIESNNPFAWKVNLFDVISAKLDMFLPTLDRNNWPSTTESNEITLYERVREQKSKRLGSKFVKVNHI